MSHRNTSKGAAGTPVPSSASQNTFARNHTAVWHKVQREHELRAVALAASGRRLSSCPLRARARS